MSSCPFVCVCVCSCVSLFPYLPLCMLCTYILFNIIIPNTTTVTVTNIIAVTTAIISAYAILLLILL